MKLVSLALESIDHYRKISLSMPVTRPSVPILYFGDQPAYDKSKIRIITVGLNPSHKEFPAENRFSRFREAEGIHSKAEITQEDVRSYLNALNDYYRNAPYNWFSCFEPLLNGMNASYYDNHHQNRALHTDLCSPIATDITWSRLNDYQKNVLSRYGNTVWHKLVEILTPDYILISVAKDYLKNIRLGNSRWKEYMTISNNKYGRGRNPYVILTSKYRKEQRDCTLVFGRAANTPFGIISNDQKREIERRLLTS